MTKMTKMTKMIFDGDCITGGTKIKTAILDKIIKSRKPVTVIHGVAGSGKSTTATEDGSQVINADTNLAKATEFVVISGASATVSGEPSKAVSTLFKRAKNVVFVIPSNFEIMRRRQNRVQVGAIDNRSEKQVKATLRAPLNNFSFVAKLRKLTKKNKIVAK